MNTETKGILFLCTVNYCRSPMAEGFPRALLPKDMKIYSAGTKPKTAHPLAIKVIKEVGIDISHQRSKGLDAIPLAVESYPTLSKSNAGVGKRRSGSTNFREVHNEIRARVESYSPFNR